MDEIELPEIVGRSEENLIIRSRNKKRVLLEDSYDVRDSVKEGASTYREIAKVTGLTNQRILQVFESYPKVYDNYKRLRMVMVDLATDNIYEIVKDNLHPKNYDASKYILQKYKSDLDNIFERSDNVEKPLVEGPKSNKQKVHLVFEKDE